MIEIIMEKKNIDLDEALQFDTILLEKKLNT